MKRADMKRKVYDIMQAQDFCVLSTVDARN